MITQVSQATKLVSLLFAIRNTKLVPLKVNLISEDINTCGLSRYEYNSSMIKKKISELFSIFFFYLITEKKMWYLKNSRKSVDTKAKARQNYRFCKKPFYPHFYINSIGTDTDVKQCQASFKYNQFLWIPSHMELEEWYSTHKI